MSGSMSRPAKALWLFHSNLKLSDVFCLARNVLVTPACNSEAAKVKTSGSQRGTATNDVMDAVKEF
jgi:hypothetical protein